MLEVKAVRKAFGNITAVDGVSLHGGRGETVGLLGPNSAGKTTTVSMIAGLLAPDSGEILIERPGPARRYRSHQAPNRSRAPRSSPF